MLMVRTQAGLGALPSIRTDATGYRAGNAPPVSTGKAPGISLEQWTIWRLIDDAQESFRHLTPEQAAGRAEHWRNRKKALAKNLPACPTESVGKPSKYAPGDCYGVLGNNAGGAGGFNPSDPIGLLAPGAFEAYGTAFGLADLKGGRFTRTFTPDVLGRRMIENALIRGSLERLFANANSVLNPQRRMLLGTGLIRQNLKAKYGSFVGEELMRKLSVQQVLDAVPDMRLFHPNLQRNPIQPSGAQRTGVGGWAAWIAEGGYPLSAAVLAGQARVSDSIAPTFCASIMCRCPSNDRPACVPGYFGKKGIAKEGELSVAFRPFIGLSSTPGDPTVTVTLVYDDPSWLEKAVVGSVGKMFDALGRLLCGNPEVIQAQMQASLAEKCANAAGVTCTKGTSGCTCTTPPASVQASVTVASVMTAGYCKGWLSEQGRPAYPPPVVDAPPPQATPSTVPWGWLIAGGLAVGAFALTRK